MLSALIIDDEMLAREELIAQLEHCNHIDIIGQVSNAIEGLKAIQRQKPDIIFLDIQMPQVTGIELLAMLDPETMPYVVFVTAYDQYAVQAFEDNAFDYLLKPIDQKRLEKTIKRLVKQTHHKQDLSAITPTLDQIPCIGLNRILLIATNDVEFAFSDVSGVQVQTMQQQATSQLCLKQLEAKTTLLRCHRQYLINPKAIHEIKLLENGLAEVITRSQHSVPVSRRYLKLLKESLGMI
ncbi:two-component system response regulator BtsR [Vibrio sp. RC27]